MNRILYTVALSVIICFAAQAQTPVTPNPAQQDATRPPGTERRQSTPGQARPNSSDPTKTPGTERPAPQSPPGVNAFPQAVPTSPAITPSVESPQLSDKENSGTASNLNQKARRPLLESLQSRDLPPLPSLVRLGVESSELLPLSLNEAIRRALENNTDIEVAREGVRITESGLRSLEGVYDPVFQITPQLSSFVTPQSSTLGGSDQSGTVSQTLIDFGPSLTRQFRTGGGQYQFFFNNTRETTSSTFAQISPAYSGNLGVTFTQPLWRNRSIDNNRRQIRIQRKRLEQSDADFRRQTINVITEVQRAYWELVFALRDQQNRIANLNLIRTQFLQTEQRIEAGSTAPVERAEVQTELSNREADVLQSVQNVSVAENNLKRLILPDSQASEWSAMLVPTDQSPFDSATPINLREALEEAHANRPELLRARLQQEMTDIDISYYRNQTRPRVDLQSTLSTTGLAGSPAASTATINGQSVSAGAATGTVPLISGNAETNANAFLLAQINQLRATQGLQAATIPFVTPQTNSVPSDLVGGYGQMLRNLAGFSTRNIVVGVTIELPLRNKTAKANLAGAQMQRKQLVTTMHGEELNIEVEVRNAAQAAETARRRVQAARESRENAEVQLQAEKELYQVGRSTTFLLFQRENQLTNARNLELRAETNYHQALADMQRATSTTLRANHVIVQTPLDP
ncbi:MAG TPA: TolC family protein [Pyrinomonadaceae bacterium]|nr:TolC family protein [Pyrinomonadaceae bacterium]